MALKQGLLGLLNYGEMTGYELAKAFNDSLSFFWQAQTSQIYRELNQLEAEGLVYTERTTGRFVTEDTALLEQLRDETARAMTAEYLEKMRGIGYGPAEAAKLMTGWETKESDSNE